MYYFVFKLTFILSVSAWNVYGGVQPCEDIDSAACNAMATQNANMCSDPILAGTACPKYCANCPIMCYNCTVSNPDVSTCKIMTCGNDEVCTVKEVKQQFGGAHSYTLGCEQKTVCEGSTKRSLQSRSVNIDCCLSNLCNKISPSTTAMPATTNFIAITSKSTALQIVFELTFILSVSAGNVYGGVQPCEDIDSVACKAMATQNANMCSDPILAGTACPKYCANCPIMCYNCTVSNPDVSTCKIMTCGNEEVCTVKEVKPQFGGAHSYTLGCEQKTVCDGSTKRSLQSRSVNIDCCLSNLCNKISPSITAMPATTNFIAITTKSTASQIGGHWSDWSSWGTCTSESASVVGYQEKSRVCTNTRSIISPTSCTNGMNQHRRLYCLGVTHACIPPRIVNIRSTETWEIGGTVYIECVVTGQPKPKIAWMQLNTNVLQVVTAGSDSSSLLIGPIKQLHSDSFRCSADNKCGSTYSVYTTPSASTAIIG